VKIPPSRGRLGAVLGRPTVIIATVVNFFFVASFASLEAGIVAEFGHEGIESGIVLAVFSVGSVVGGLVLGHRNPSRWSMLNRSLIVLAGTAACLINMHPVWLSVALLLGGIGVAPLFAAIFSTVSATVRFSETAEAYAWVGTGMLVGVALGSAAAGIAIDRLGGIGGVLISTGLLVATVIAAIIGARWLPDLRGKDATPIPDTVPIQLPLRG